MDAVTTPPASVADLLALPATPKFLLFWGHRPQRDGSMANFDDQTWSEHRFEIVTDASRHKFGRHDDLRAWLVGTGDRVLVEASPTDRVWGIGLAATDERATDPARWRGLNLLGFALMRARNEWRVGGN
ncbi:NADAR family protein [Actinoplanes sp. NPDC051513]|uniref:NADAR family protein n=1 Tax=Actinoplanes sp. NPDC051513 TaxID=3363908 RepID=UPI003798A490